MKNDAFAPPKNEPKTNPISNFPLGFNQFMKNMQNEPNLKNAQINLSPFKANNYENKRPCTHGKTNPIRTQFAQKQTQFQSQAKH